ncbi:maleylpyruvate isomerase family mycothiol-dependent enzyme [Arthrobacter alpinus]|uniref:maleylpyruvate isomerase family mycothiol-dependent enzyme n=1 Tax=Arthrobacter alpinus TaxID=656366 RepID=UPI0016449922|nr:maleylpyruvate isomerase family mycothiol-dependent enzyme [Arthrobacter alpinus]
MPPDFYLSSLDSSLDRLKALATQPNQMLARPVPACPDWRLEDLLGHLGSIERWVVDVLRGGKYVEEQPRPAGGAAAWFLDGADNFQRAMKAIDPHMPCWNLGPPPRTAGFWLRRQAHEHAIHLVDACQASGFAAPPDFGEDFMLDGIDEVLAMFVPRQLRLKRMPEPEGAVVFHVSRTIKWTIGQGPTRASVTAPLSEMYLGLWCRSKLADIATVEGDASVALRVLQGPLTP